MTTELVLLLAIFAFIVGGLFFGEKGPIKVFEKSGPRLAARIEKHITVGREFKVKGGNYNQWAKAPGNAPDGHL
jgi:hypothetical protein